MKVDVAIIGGGPAGSIAGKYAAASGAKTIIIEEHPAIGEPIQCAGIISRRAASACEVKRGDFLIRTAQGAFINSPNHRLRIDGHEEKAWIIDRKIFDRELASRAIDAGCEILLKAKVVEGGQGRLEVRVNGEREIIEAGVLIAAEGVKRRISRLYLGDTNLPRIIPAIQTEVRCDFEDSDFVEVFLGKKVAPGFFGWMIPTEDGFGRVGLGIASDGIKASALSYLERLISDHPLIRGSTTDFVLGGIPIGMAKKTVSDGFIAVGDAAGQVKPTTGGGIYTGAVCARIAGRVAAEAVLDGDTTRMRLLEYEKKWRRLIGKELSIGFKIHRWFSGLDDRKLDQLIESLNDPEIIRVIENFGDMDKPSILFRELISLPKAKVAGLLFSLMKSF
ncbi:MAG: geranylgeranyl reductase family protein [Candidatus Syntropharchaeales archaeon]